MRDMDIYSSLYDIVDENMTNAGQKLQTSKELVMSFKARLGRHSEALARAE